MADPIRLLLLADSHLGFDLPARPRVARRRRGHDFLANHAAALAPALAGEVDLVVHGGDVFDRPRVPASLAYQAYDPLLRVADAGVPVFVVPGNHERGRLPHAGLLRHRRVHVFDRPRTFTLELRGRRLALSGFPYERRNVRARLGELLAQTGWEREPAALRLLCLHHCVEGATVGPGNFTFTTGDDVIRTAHLPAGFAAVLSGHIHRPQVLTTDLRGRPLALPVLYPGSVERTSTAEKDESKGYLVLQLDPDAAEPVRWEFRPLPARPLVVQEIDATGLSPAALDAAMHALVAAAPADAVLRVRVRGRVPEGGLAVLSAASVRRWAPGAMNVEIRVDQLLATMRRERPAGRRPCRGGAELELELGLG